jgi:hypothetical protein
MPAEEPPPPPERSWWQRTGARVLSQSAEFSTLAASGAQWAQQQRVLTRIQACSVPAG